jgi:hypothetical protein
MPQATQGIAMFSFVGLLLLLSPEPIGHDAGRYFAIQVVDEQTGRGVPMVELQTTSGARYITDSAGLIAFYEPGLMSKRVYFGVTSHGYEFPPDGFGSRGQALEVKGGGSATLKIKRVNIAERLYRITGQGIYRDTVLLGRKAPIETALLNAEVTGQDGVLNAIYQGKLFWFYGDTGRLSYALGNFAMAGATTDLPDRLDPARGFDLKYFCGKDGFARPMTPIPGEGVVWLSGLVVLPDKSGRERMLAYYQRRRGLGAVLENGFVVYNDQKQVFEKLKTVPLSPVVHPQGYPFRAKENGTEYLYFTAPYPAVRVKADLQFYLDLASYESFTCLKTGIKDETKKRTDLDCDAGGKLVWNWKKNSRPLDAGQQETLIKAGRIRPDESPLCLRDRTGKRILLNNCSCAWNAYRKRYVMIASQALGATMLGEVWYSEADRPEGPWREARKIITHANKPGDAHDFYNPVHHPFFDREGGKIIYLEGSYVNTFSGNPHPTPYYEYNQIMYRLDLSDPRLK